MNDSPAASRKLLPALLVAAVAAGFAFAATRAIPLLWVRLFPTPAPVVQAPAAPAPDRETVSLALDQAVVAGGGELPPKRADGDAGTVPLPRGLSPRDLESALRADPRLEGTSIYVTRADALLWSLRVFAGPELLLKRELRPWLPASPPHPPSNPPELVVLVDLRGVGDGDPVLRWTGPLAVVLEPFVPSTLRRARDAAKASHAVVGALRPDEPLHEQIQAIPHISAVLVEAPLPPGIALDAFLGPLAESGLTLVDACPRGCFEARDVQSAGVPLLRLATRLGGDGPAGGDGELALARNLAVQWGYGLVLADPSSEGLERTERLLDGGKADGLRVVFVEEAGRLHGLAPLPGG